MAPSISDIDKNFKVNLQIKKDDIDFYSIDDKPFKIYGVFKENGKYRRMPETVAKTVSDGVYGLHSAAAGGRVRFKTDSAHIYIISKMDKVRKMPHFAFSGSAGFDLYVKSEKGYDFIKTFMPSIAIEDGYESSIDLHSKKMRDLTINLPLYSSVCELLIGIDEGSVLDYGDGYSCDKKIVYYGSSITQGGCASRPGNCYQGFISRRFDCDYINLGFSGNAKGEKEITDYIASLDMDIFVYDYDHNAPTAEHLQSTHQKMFGEIRKAHPDIPIILMSRPKINLLEDELQRLEIIKKTYNDAKNGGDKKVYLIEGTELMKYTGNDGTVDNCHPNDLGFYSMARVLGDLLESII